MEKEIYRDVRLFHAAIQLYSAGTSLLGTDIKGLSTVLQANPKPLVVTDKDGRPPAEFGVSKSMECDTFSLQCTVDWVTGRALARKRLSVAMLTVMI